MSPVERGNWLRVKNAMRVLSQRARTTESEETAITSSTYNTDTIVGKFQFGLAANRPQAAFLQERGTGGMLYFATDTNVLSAWTGVAWKTTTLT
jgi:hypothetical protein